MSLAKILFELPTERLREIVRARASTIRGLPRIESKQELARALATGLTSYDSVQRALRETSMPEYRLLSAVVARGGHAKLSDLIISVEPDSDRLIPVVDSLEGMGLAFWTGEGEGRSVFVPRGVSQHIPLPAPIRMRLEVALEAIPARGLSTIASELGVDPGGSNRKSLSILLTELLRDRARVAKLVDSLSPEGEKAARAVIESGGVVSLQDLAQEIDARKRRQVMELSWNPFRYDSDPRNGAEELLSRGLVFQDQVGSWGGGRLVMPIEVLEAFRDSEGPAGLPREPAWETVPAAGKPQHSHESLIRDVAFLFGFIERTDTPQTNAGVMYRTALKALARGLTIPEHEYAEFVYAVASEAGLIGAGGRKNLYSVTRRGLAWLAQKPDVQRRALFEAYLGSTLWSESNQRILADGKSYRSAQDAREYREAVIQLLKEAGGQHAGEAISLDSITRRAEFHWWARFRFHARQSEESVDSNRELVERIAGKSLHWLGLTAANAGSVLLTQSGRRLLGLDHGELPAQAIPDKFVVQPNLEVFAPPNLPSAILYRLFGMTEPAGRSMLTLTRESLRQAMDGGETSESILEFLRAHSQTGIAQNVEYLVKEVAGRHGQIEVGQAGLYLRVSDPTLLKELEAQRGLKIGFRRKLSDTIALITGDSVDGVLKALRHAGYLPVSPEDRRTAKAAAKPARRDTDFSEIEAPPRPSVAEIDTRIDWGAVAADDGQVYTPPETAKAPATNGSHYIENLAIRAMEDQRCLEIVYKPADGGSRTQRVIEPHDLNGPILYAYCRLRDDFRNFNIRCIQSARLTEEGFEWRDS